MRTSFEPGRSNRAAFRAILKLVLGSFAVIALVAGIAPPQSADAHHVDPFDDVRGDAWYADAIRWMVAEGITTGTSPTTFSPNRIVSRAEFATFLHRDYGSPSAPEVTRFSDVPRPSYFAKPVDWMVDRNITNGVSSTLFGANRQLTRAQAVTFMWRAAGRPTPAQQHPFGDVPAGSYFDQPASWAWSEGIVNGTSTTAFSPHDPVTRAIAAVLLYRQAGEPPVDSGANTHPVAITSPTPGSELGCGDMTLRWIGPNEATYNITVGTSPGNANIDNATSISGFSHTVSDIPSSASTIYVSLFRTLPSGSPQLMSTASYEGPGPECAPPTWIPGAEITPGSISQYWFNFEFCCVSANVEWYDIRVTRNDGQVENLLRYHFELPAGPEVGGSFVEIGSFHGYALEEGSSYTVEIWAANSAGSTTQPLVLEVPALPVLSVTAEWMSTASLQPEHPTADGLQPSAETCVTPQHASLRFNIGYYDWGPTKFRLDHHEEVCWNPGEHKFSDNLSASAFTSCEKDSAGTEVYYFHTNFDLHASAFGPSNRESITNTYLCRIELKAVLSYFNLVEGSHVEVQFDHYFSDDGYPLYDVRADYVTKKYFDMFGEKRTNILLETGLAGVTAPLRLDD